MKPTSVRKLSDIEKNSCYFMLVLSVLYLCVCLCLCAVNVVLMYSHPQSVSSLKLIG